MRSRWIAATTVACALTLTSSAEAQQGQYWHAPFGWRIIGHKVVNGGSDTDWIYTPGARRYHQLRLCAYNAALHMKDFDIYFRNGGHQDVSTRDRLNPGMCTRIVEIRGGARDITRIRLKYGRMAGGLQAPTVRLTAR
jgi:hypothetical protein